MIPLPLAWTLLTVSLWTCGSSQILLQETTNILYPKLFSDESIDCDCVNISCDSVYWFRSILNNSKLEFLARTNNADRVFHHTKEKERFKLSRRSSMSFVLRIIGVTEADAGIYSCVLKDKSNTELWNPGTLLLPGVTLPTLPPKTKPPVNPICRCSAKNLPRDGCGSLVLWPLAGLIAGLALALVCTLYYFSRLPKKCRHHFVKKRQMI